MEELRPVTSKQKADACEMLVAAELTLAGVPAMKMPDNWPHYDVVAQPPGGGPAQRISVKTRTYKAGDGRWVDYWRKDDFDWLAVVFLLPGEGRLNRRFFLVSKDLADVKGGGPKEKTR